MNSTPHRATIYLEDARILGHESHPGEQRILKLEAPKCAQAARPGSFAHLQCDPLLPMRRPLSIMRVDPEAGWVEFLYKIIGYGTRLLARRRPGENLSLLGPIGRPFAVHADRPRAVLIGGGVGIPPMIFLANHLRRLPGFKPLAILGSEVPFPFIPRPSRILVPGMPDGIIAAMPLLEDWLIPSRLASLQGFPGCHDGYVTDLVVRWLDTLSPRELAEVELFACGPHPMLEAVARLARKYDLPAQVSLEEFMACGVGGCAGCTVAIETADGQAMKRVCVDGPVFDAATVAAFKPA